MGNYNVDKSLEVKLNNKTFIPAGIHENLSLVEVLYGVSPNGFEYISFKLEDEFENYFIHNEYEVRPSKPLEAMSDQEKQGYLSALDTQKRRIGQIVTTFVAREKYSFIANTFKEFADNIIKILNDRDKTLKCRAKIVYSNKGWTTFPKYWKYTFVEPMSVSKETSKIRPLGIDNFVRKSPDIESIPQEDNNIPEVPETPSEGPGNDLPF